MRKLLLLAILLVVVGAAMGAEQKFPKFTLEDLDGNLWSIDSILSFQKPVILTFWATWCKPCRKELNKFVEYWDSWDTTKGERPYVIVALCEDSPRSVRKAKSLAKKQGWDRFILLHDKGGHVKMKAGVAEIPELFILKPDGTIYYRHIGFNPGDEQETYKKIEELLKELNPATLQENPSESSTEPQEK